MLVFFFCKTILFFFYEITALNNHQLYKKKRNDKILPIWVPRVDDGMFAKSWPASMRSSFRTVTPRQEAIWNGQYTCHAHRKVVHEFGSLRSVSKMAGFPDHSCLWKRNRFYRLSPIVQTAVQFVRKNTSHCGCPLVDFEVSYVYQWKIGEVTGSRFYLYRYALYKKKWTDTSGIASPEIAYLYPSLILNGPSDLLYIYESVYLYSTKEKGIVVKTWETQELKQKRSPHFKNSKFYFSIAFLGYPVRHP